MKQFKTVNLKKWWVASMIRALRSVAQAAIAAIGSTALITEVDWKVVGATAAMTGVLSILTSIATGLPEVPEEVVTAE